MKSLCCNSECHQHCLNQYNKSKETVGKACIYCRNGSDGEGGSEIMEGDEGDSEGGAMIMVVVVVEKVHHYPFNDYHHLILSCSC